MKRLALLLLPVVATSCGYALVGNANNLLGPAVHTIQVPAFVNKTTRVELEHRHLDRHGDGWEGLRAGVEGNEGWPLYLARYAEQLDPAI